MQKKNSQNDNYSIYNEIKISDDQYNLKLIKKSNEFNFIYDFICHDDYILLSDMYKSISLFKYEDSKEKFFEVSRDFNPLWVNSLCKSDENTYSVSDVNGNIYILKSENFPKNDEDKYK